MLGAAVLVCNDGGARVMAVVVGRRAAKPGWLPCWGQQLAHVLVAEKFCSTADFERLEP